MRRRNAIINTTITLTKTTKCLNSKTKFQIHRYILHFWVKIKIIKCLGSCQVDKPKKGMYHIMLGNKLMETKVNSNKIYIQTIL
jgi:hypothetical protein